MLYKSILTITYREANIYGSPGEKLVSAAGKIIAYFKRVQEKSIK